MVDGRRSERARRCRRRPDRDAAGYVYESCADVVDLLDPGPGERVLDRGCGTGRLTPGSPTASDTRSGRGGRFVAGLGGPGTVRRIRQAVADALAARGRRAPDPFPTPGAASHAGLLARPGFEGRSVPLFDRPTDFADGSDGLRNWPTTFGEGLFAPLDASARPAVLSAVGDRPGSDASDPETGRGPRTTGLRVLAAGPA